MSHTHSLTLIHAGRKRNPQTKPPKQGVPFYLKGKLFTLKNGSPISPQSPLRPEPCTNEAADAHQHTPPVFGSGNMSVSTSHSSLRWVLLVLLAFLVFVLLQRQQLYGATSRASLLFPSTSASGGGVPSITQTLQPRFGFKHSPPPPMGNPPLPLVKHAADLTPPPPPPH